MSFFRYSLISCDREFDGGDASRFNLSVFQKLDRPGTDRDGVYAIRETPLVMLSWQEFFSERGGYRVTHLNLSPAAAFILAIVLGFFPTWAILTPRLRHRSRRRRGLCLACGYDLAGNPSGICPECGAEACRDIAGSNG